MSELTQAKVVNGRMLILQADGSWAEAVSQTDLDKVAATTDEEVERQAKEDGDDEWFDESRPYTVVNPQRTDAAE